MSADDYPLVLGAAASLALGVLLARRPAGDGFARLLLGLLPLALFTTAVSAWAAFRLVPEWNWSAARLAASVRLVQGFPLYTGPGDAAINGWIYGPVSALAHAPAAFARDPLTALRWAAGLNALYYLLPIAILFAGHLAASRTRATGLMILAFAVSVMLAPFGTWYGAAALNSDVVATGLGVGSCVVLVRHRRLPLAALLCVAAAWTKQIEALLAVAQLLYLFRTDGGRTAGIYAGWLGLAALVTAGGFVAWFGAAPLWHCLIVIPGGHPIEPARLASMLMAAARATWWVWPILILVRPWRSSPGNEKQASASPAALLVLAAVIVLPAGVLAAAKAGGDQNSLHSTVYAALGGTLLLVRMIEGNADRLRAIGRLTLLGGALLAAGFNLHRVVTHDHLAVRAPGAHHREAFAFARTHPGEAYFPCNPLITLLAEGRNYPFDYGLFDWRLAGWGADRAALRPLFPSTLRYIVYHEKDPSHEIRGLFPEFSRGYQTGPWDFFVRQPSQASPDNAPK